MDYFPIFVAVKSRKLLFVGGSMDIVHKVRLVMKSTSDIHVFSPDEIAPDLKTWADQGKITIHHRQMTADDSNNAVFAFIDGDDGPRRDHAMAIFDEQGLLYAVIDDQSRSRFITPALVDRDPVVVAIGTEGTGPVIARDIKAKIEHILNPAMGIVAKVAGSFRPKVEVLPKGGVRRQFWSQFLHDIAPNIMAKRPENMEQQLTQGLEHSLVEAQRGNGQSENVSNQAISIVHIASDDANLLTRGAFNIIHDADLVIHDCTIGHSLLELTRRESIRVEALPHALQSLAKLAITHLEKGDRVVVLADAHGGRGVNWADINWAERGVQIHDVTGYITPPLTPSYPQAHPQHLKVAS